MNAPTSPLPASLLRAEAEETDLEARIRQAEQRLIAREENLRRRFSLVTTRARDRIAPWRKGGPRALLVAGAVSVAGFAFWLWRGRGDAPARSAAGAGHDAAAGRGFAASELPWVRLIGLAWPLMPAGWRSRLSPATINVMMTLGTPLVERLLLRPKTAPLATVGPLHPEQLVGVWYEVARLPASRDLRQRSLQHRLQEDQSLERIERRVAPDGAVTSDRATVLPVPGSGGSRLRSTAWPALLQWLPLAWQDESVLHLDDDAGELVIGSPARDRLRVLSRRRELPTQRMQALLQMARERGFAADIVQFPEAG